MMNNLPPEIIDNHILPFLDGTTLTALSSVSSEFRRMITHKDELWKNICASTWPNLQPVMNNIVSTFPGGYRSFFSDAFPSLDYSSNNNKRFKSVEHPPIFLFYFIDMYLEGGSHTGGLMVDKFFPDVLNTQSENYGDFLLFTELYPEKNGCWVNYFQDNLRLNWIVIDGTRKRAMSLFGPCSKPVSIKRTVRTIEVVYEKVMPGQCEDYTEMVKCHVKVSCCWRPWFKDGRKDFLEVRMEDMNGKRVLGRHANMIFLNAIHNGERKRKKF